MKVAIYNSNTDFEIVEKPTPEISGGEILVKVRASGICGSDVIEWYRKKKKGSVLGHEIAGKIVESKSSKFKENDKVFVSHHVPCGECDFCINGQETACETLHNGNYDPGGFSEFVRVPKINVERGTYLLDDLTYEEGTMIEPLACVIRAQNLLDIKKGDKILILGCGISGLLNIQLAKLNGAEVTATDIDEYHMDKAKEFKADYVVNATKGIREKVDTVIVCTGAEAAVKDAYNCVERNGRIMFFAIPGKTIEIPGAILWRNELTVLSSYGAAPKDLEIALTLIQQKKVNVMDLITHKLGLDQIEEGFKIVSEAKNSLKVVLVP